MAITDGERAQALQMGELIQAVRALKQAVETLEADIADLKDKYRFGKGALFGLSLAAGFALYGVKETFLRWFGPN